LALFAIFAISQIISIVFLKFRLPEEIRISSQLAWHDAPCPMHKTSQINIGILITHIFRFESF